MHHNVISNSVSRHASGESHVVAIPFRVSLCDRLQYLRHNSFLHSVCVNHKRRCRHEFLHSQRACLNLQTICSSSSLRFNCLITLASCSGTITVSPLFHTDNALRLYRALFSRRKILDRQIEVLGPSHRVEPGNAPACCQPDVPHSSCRIFWQVEAAQVKIPGKQSFCQWISLRLRTVMIHTAQLGFLRN